MSTDEETDSVDESTRSSVERDPGPTRDREGGASDAASAAIRDVEQLPLAERAPGYQSLAERLRVELEQSDPHATR